MTASSLSTRRAERVGRSILTLAASAVLSACALIPDPPQPDLVVPAAFAGADALSARTLDSAEEPGRWQPAEPADMQAPSPWWRIFADPVLVQLEEDAMRANPDVAIAMARLQQARALAMHAEAARLPSLDLGFGPTRQRSSGAAAGLPDGAPGTTQTLWRAQASVAYEVDLFGRVASAVAASRADADQSQALAHQMLLLVQADVARNYFTLQQLEGEQRLLSRTVQLRENALRLLTRQREAGAIAAFVVEQSSAQLFSARADLEAITRQRTLSRHALATLLGQAPGAFALKVQPLASVDIRIPAGLPSSLLERRPDIAAAARAMAAENARIGIARAAFFPSLSLTGALGYESAELGNLAQWSQRTFLLGPLVGTALSLPIFDGGRRQADEDRARMAYEQRVAEYRKTVLQGFREVEDALASLRTLDQQIVHLRAATQAASNVARSASSRFGEGDVDYLAVVDAERTLLRSQQSAIQAEGERVRATVDLVRALGGGWQAPGARAPGNTG